MKVCRLIKAALLSTLPAAPSGAVEHSIAVFAGGMTENVWEDTLTPWVLDGAGSTLIGVAWGLERPLGQRSLSAGLEFQLLSHAGTQDHVEIAVPAVVRYRPERALGGVIDGLAFGLGLSYATDVPEVEVSRAGESERLLVYWFAETEFPELPWGQSPFLRLHHRSNAFGLIEADAGSNAIVLGLRQRF